MALRAQILTYELARIQQIPSPLFASGHWTIDTQKIDRFGENWNFLTVLRHPTERFLSEYFFNRYKAERAHFGTELSLSDHLEDEDTKSRGRMLCHYFSDIKDWNAPQSEITDKALDTLKRFKLIGFLDKLDRFADEFETCFGVRPAIGDTNKNPASDKMTEALSDPSIVSQIEEICSADIALYNAALRLPNAAI
jgi:hypothetical protein